MKPKRKIQKKNTKGEKDKLHHFESERELYQKFRHMSIEQQVNNEEFQRVIAAV